MVDGVELVPLDQPDQVWELDRDDALRGEDAIHAGGEVVEVGDVGEDVVGDEEVGAAALGGEPVGDRAAEELHDGLDALGAGGLGDVGGGLDAQRRDAQFGHVLEQIAVVARELDDEAVAVEAEAVDGRGDRVARVGDPGVGVGGEVGVLGEDLFGGDEFLKLDEETALAGAGVERIERLHRAEAVGGDVGLTQGRHTQVDEGMAQLGAAEAAHGACRLDRGVVRSISNLDGHAWSGLQGDRLGADGRNAQPAAALGVEDQAGGLVAGGDAELAERGREMALDR